jgi:uncharacterized SAM-binding protein YcdF (DUF218 family)
MRIYTPDQIAQAKTLFAYLALLSPNLSKVDVIVGFGHFDLNIPRHCGELYTHGYADRIIFTGGIGSGTADLGKPEAQAFAEELQRSHPYIPEEAIIIEDTSTNTGENVQFTIQKLKNDYPDFTFGNEIRSAILVANSYRQHRVFLTCRKKLPQMTFYNAPPAIAFEDELAVFARKGYDLIELLVGEIDRIVRYGERGFLAQIPLPQKVHHLYTTLKRTTQRAV